MNHESCLETQVTELSQEHSEEKYYLYLNFGAAFRVYLMKLKIDYTIDFHLVVKRKLKVEEIVRFNSLIVQLFNFYKNIHSTKKK